MDPYKVTAFADVSSLYAACLLDFLFIGTHVILLIYWYTVVALGTPCVPRRTAWLVCRAACLWCSKLIEAENM
jgi:hypothetical protein